MTVGSLVRMHFPSFVSFSPCSSSSLIYCTAPSPLSQVVIVFRPKKKKKLNSSACVPCPHLLLTTGARTNSGVWKLSFIAGHHGGCEASQAVAVGMRGKAKAKLGKKKKKKGRKKILRCRARCQWGGLYRVGPVGWGSNLGKLQVISNQFFFPDCCS